MNVGEPEPGGRTEETVLDSLLDGIQAIPLINQTWPVRRSLSLVQWGEASDPRGTRELLSLARFLREVDNVPIVAVAGMLNGGKSSLVASFLSARGRDRALVGHDSRHATHRFTFWLPGSWEKDMAILGQTEDLLAEVFNQAAERLSAEPEIAHDQQNAPDTLDVPLLAFDDGLNRLGIALLDCPDAQRAQPEQERRRKVRLEFLRKAGILCTGIILVARRSEVETQDLPDIAGHLPSATRIYAINHLRDEAPHTVLRDLPTEIRASGDPVFVAYDFLVPENAQFAPELDQNFRLPTGSKPARRLPFFFEAKIEEAENAPNAIECNRKLTELGPRLRPDVLRQRRQAERRATLKAGLAQKLATLDDDLRRRNSEVDDAAKGLREQCRNLIYDDGQQRIKMDAEIVSSMADAIWRTAPWDLKMALTARRGLLAIVRGAGKVSQFVNPRKWRERVAEASRSRSKERHVITAKRLQDVLFLWSAEIGCPRHAKFWAEDAAAIMDRFRQEERTNMTEEEWDETMSQAWKIEPKGWVRMRAVTPFLLALAAAAAFAIDPTTATSHAILGITLKELLAATAAGGFLGGILGLKGANVVSKEIEKRIGRQQFENFFAIVCDQIGLPRGAPPTRKSKCPAAKIPEQRNRDAFGIEERHWLRATVDQTHLRRISSLIDKL